MFELMSHNAQRLKNILTFFVLRTEWITHKELANELDTSVRTLSNDIKYLKERWGDHLNFESHPQFGIREHSLSVNHVESIINDMTKESLALSLIEILFFEPNMDLDYYVDALFTSRSSLLRSLNKIQEYLESKSIFVLHNNGKYSLYSEAELDLRKFFSRFFIELYQSDFARFPIAQGLKAFVDMVASKTKFADNDVSYNLIHFYIQISLYRENQGFQLEVRDRDIKKEQIYQSLRYTFKNLQVGSLSIIEDSVLSFKVSEDYKYNDSYIDKSIQSFIDSISKTFVYDIRKEDEDSIKLYLRNIYYQYRYYPALPLAVFSRIKYFCKMIEHESPVATEIMNSLILNLTYDLDLEYKSVKNDILYWVLVQIPAIIRRNNQEYTILLVTDLGSEHNHFIKSLIDNLSKLNSNLNLDIDIYPSRFYEGSDDASYNLIITTNQSIINSTLPLVLIHDFPTHNDLYMIQESLKKNPL